jgi:integrase
MTTYTSKYRTFNLWLQKHGFENVDISCINNDIILAFFNYLINERKLSGNSISKYTQNLRALFNFARQQKAITVNPVYDIPLCRRVNDMAPRPIAEFDIQKFKDEISIKNPQLWLAISFEYYCFLRPGKELRLLKIGDIDFARGIIDVDRFRAKTNMERFPTIPLVFLHELRDVYKLHTYPKQFYVFGKNYEPSDKCIGKNNLRYRFNDVREKIGMPYSYKFYSWKHTGNGRASDAGISLSALQEQNGHSSIKTTEIYLRHKIGKVDNEIRNNFPGL